MPREITCVDNDIRSGHEREKPGNEPKPGRGDETTPATDPERNKSTVD
ncbi:hypothetical protein SAMN05444320_102673 [Streptoalloteichus hindustanus]|uniref:Uncharacterized protein n=1 Tax=Streptoalloteichus hindustanus TaxID=2017 RepID=A0A1M4ZBA1_STRHI|nr:hypothetical protein SAMN05444320_102673 [Streptoalloteichus hindustanus]